MADSKLTALSELSVPALEDLTYLVDDPSGTPASVKLSLNRFGGLLTRAAFGYRLTTESGVPISTSDRSAQSTIYLTPDPASTFCQLVSLYDGTRWKLYTNAEVSLALSSLTSGKNYDVFLYDNSGTLTLELSAAWTNDTTRADALTTQDGIYVKSGATTRRYVGTIRTTGTTTTEDSDAKRFVWNLHNQVPRRLQKAYNSTSFWSYSSTTVRQANADSANQVEAVNGLTTFVDLLLVGIPESGSSHTGLIGLGFDSTSAFASDCYATGADLTSGVRHAIPCRFARQVALGYHFYSFNEASSGSGAAFNFFGDRGYGRPGCMGSILG